MLATSECKAEGGSAEVTSPPERWQSSRCPGCAVNTEYQPSDSHEIRMSLAFEDWIANLEERVKELERRSAPCQGPAEQKERPFYGNMEHPRILYRHLNSKTYEEPPQCRD